MDAREARFFTAESAAADGAAANRGELLFVSCRTGSRLAAATVERYRQLDLQAGSTREVGYLAEVDWSFSDSETGARLERHVGGTDAFLFQTLFDPARGGAVNDNYLALLIAARALREHGAQYVTAVLPYLAYARQDKPSKFRREPTTAKLMADLTMGAGVDGLVVWAPHSRQLHGFYGSMPIRLLDPLTMFIQEFGGFRGRRDVVAVSPDAGASKLVTHFARALDLASAIGIKSRPGPEQVSGAEVIGDLTGKRVAVVLDDLIGSGGTLEAVIRRLVEGHDIREVHVAAAHMLAVGQARERLLDLHRHRHLVNLVTTDSVPLPLELVELPFVTVRSLADILAWTVNRLHFNRSLSELFYRD